MKPNHRFEWCARAFLLALIVHMPVVWAEQAMVYQCKDKSGAVIFSGTPCGPDAKALVIEAPNAGTGGAAARQGIDDLAKQYDQRQAQARKEAADLARAEAKARAAEQARGAQVPPAIQNAYYYGGYPIPGRYYDRGSSGFDRSIGRKWRWSVGGHIGDGDRDRPHDRSSPPYRPPESPGISGRFPGGIPGMRQ